MKEKKFSKCKVKCVWEQPKCMAIGLKLCPACQDIFKSTCSKGKCQVDGKKPIMIVPAAATASSSKQKAPGWVWKRKQLHRWRSRPNQSVKSNLRIIGPASHRGICLGKVVCCSVHRPVINVNIARGCRPPKQRFTAMAYDSKLHAILLWHVISVKLNIGKKITRLEIMALNH